MTKVKFLWPFIAGLIVLTGLFLRLYHISDNQFLFYDEGMYLGYNRAFLELVANNPPHSLNELGIILSLMFKASLTTAKALWFFILNLRVFILGPESWFFARWISAASGLATVVLLYFWSKRYFNSSRIAGLSSLLLMVLPSHVFYSRLGMQESLSTLLFLAAVYLYMLREDFHWSFFLSVFLLACVYLTNYRMIIAPIFIAFIEFFLAKTMPRQWQWKKTVVYFICFYALVLWVGLLYGGINLYVNAAWMFHQAQDAGGKFNPINFLSYPYDILVLEGFFFACLFWSNFYLIKIKEYRKLLAFGMVLLQMLMFSFAAEKGSRYLCVVLPFMAAAVAVVVDDAWERFAQTRVWLGVFLALGLGWMIGISTSLSLGTTDYEEAVHFIIDHDPNAVIISTQPLVESMYVSNPHQIVPCPNDLYSLVNLYKQGARYLILDPQAYISWTADGRRFSPPLDDFLEMTLENVRPLQTFPHLNGRLLQRFVLDHNEQILDSVQFLSMAPSKGYGLIRIYELGSVFSVLQHMELAR